MKYNAGSPGGYINQIPEDRKEAMEKLRTTIKDNLSEGFEETMYSSMISYVVPHSIYKAGYHVNPKDPLPFMAIASQKNYIALYHLGMYANPDVLEWFQEEYPKHVRAKLDMGKSCIRFKNIEDIPFELLAELCRKITLEDYCKQYEETLLKMKNSK